jgi:UDP-N-acetylglucosamine 2-epimerase
MHHSYIIVTNSGGVQEEAPSLDRPFLVMREVTKRPDGIEGGILVSRDREGTYCTRDKSIVEWYGCPQRYGGSPRPLR